MASGESAVIALVVVVIMLVLSLTACVWTLCRALDKSNEKALAINDNELQLSRMNREINDQELLLRESRRADRRVVVRGPVERPDVVVPIKADPND